MARTFFHLGSGGGINITEDEIPRFQVKMYDRYNTMARIAKLGSAVKKASVKAQLGVGNRIRIAVRAHIRKQDLPWPGLRPSYRSRKQAADVSSKLLINYKTYYDNIETWRVGSRHLVNIGVRKGIYTKTLGGKRSKVDVATIAFIHEFSSGKRLARRPLWNPTIQEFGGARGIKEMYVNTLVYWVRKDAHIPIKKLGGSRLGVAIEVNGQERKITF